MLGGLLKWLSVGILDRLLSHLETRIDNETEQRRLDADIVREQIKGEILARAEARKVLIAESGHFWSAGRLGRLLFVVPLGIWWTAICLDSTFLFGWGVDEVPVLREWGGAIITSLFLVDGAQSVVRGLTLRGRR
ncbi:MAG: hypothetical protein ABJJ37_27000 [Roseibium sp.]